jgi:hypothetical protein
VLSGGLNPPVDGVRSNASGMMTYGAARAVFSGLGIHCGAPILCGAHHWVATHILTDRDRVNVSLAYLDGCILA